MDQQSHAATYADDALWRITPPTKVKGRKPVTTATIYEAWPAEITDLIRSMAGTRPLAEISAATGLTKKQLMNWGYRRGVNFRAPVSMDETHRYDRLRSMAEKQGLFLRADNGRYKLYDPITDDWADLDEIERLLRRRQPEPVKRRKLSESARGAITGNTTGSYGLRETPTVTLPTLRFLEHPAE